MRNDGANMAQGLLAEEGRRCRIGGEPDEDAEKKGRAG